MTGTGRRLVRILIFLTTLIVGAIGLYLWFGDSLLN